MDSFNTIKRRTTDLFSSVPSSLPALPTLPSLPSIKNPLGSSHTMKGTWEKIKVPPLPRSLHTVDIVSGTVYIFGGETSGSSPDNDMHTVTLPSSGAQADYFAIKAKSASSGDTSPGSSVPSVVETPVDDETEASKSLSSISLSTPSASTTKGNSPIPDTKVPSPRVGHATAVIGHRILLFGGRSPDSDGASIDESGRVWIFDTRTSLWSHSDPVPDTMFPSPRYGHAAVATEKPDTFSKPRSHHSRHPQSWQDWALGSSSEDRQEYGTPQNPVVGTVAEKATDLDADGYGTFIIAGGVTEEKETDEVWAFDVRGKTWQVLPSLGTAVVDPALAISKSRLYAFTAGNKLEYLELVVDNFNDKFSGGEEVVLSSRDGGWKTLGVVDENGGLPAQRQAAGLQAITVGGGREYLVLMFGVGSGPNRQKYLDDVWVYQVPSQGMSIASATDTVLGVVGRKGEGRWTAVELGPEDDEDDASAEGPDGRAWIASATMGELEENGIVIWGGKGEGETVLGDGWILRLG
ncbi:nitrile-specifier protein 2 [Cladorrhinum samala]|uniref:Nitrile-specifier protein 2 n=1 Tax=Cladorrhinum samala TaxID=585594 RepID=A0AAV9HR99_9PEZI|nr:nitrile-specifier protein 2 [Cladorrhinum samala]